MSGITQITSRFWNHLLINFGNEQGSIKSTDLEKIMVFHNVLQKHYKDRKIPMEKKSDIGTNKQIVKRSMASNHFPHFSIFLLFLTAFFIRAILG